MFQIRISDKRRKKIAPPPIQLLCFMRTSFIDIDQGRTQPVHCFYFNVYKVYYQSVVFKMYIKTLIDVLWITRPSRSAMTLFSLTALLATYFVLESSFHQH